MRTRFRSEISPGNSLSYFGKQTDQNFILLPVYPNKNSLPHEVVWWVRFIEPLRDRNNRILFLNDRVQYKNEICIVTQIFESIDGDQAKASLKSLNSDQLYSEVNIIDSENPITKFTGSELTKIM